jgi:hypothetical protein
VFVVDLKSHVLCLVVWSVSVDSLLVLVHLLLCQYILVGQHNIQDFDSTLICFNRHHAVVLRPILLITFITNKCTLFIL